MSLMPEFIFRAVIARGFRTIRQDTRFLDQLFRNLDQESAQEMRDFIQNKKINLDINYPREALKVPAIIILLRSESEAQAFLGDEMGVDCVPEVMSYDDHDNSSLDIIGGAATASTLAGQGKLVFGPMKVVSATNNTLKIEQEDWNQDQYRTESNFVHIIGGLGVGQRRMVTANGRNTLMIDTNWNVNPDDTSVFEIRTAPGEIVGEPSSIYTREGAETIERLGSLYRMNYQVQIIGPNPELTVYLHAILKAIFTMARQFMEGQGIINFQMGATDFLPKAEYIPDHAYMRALNIEFLYPFDVFVQLGDLAESFRIALEDSSGDILSDTTC